MYPKFIPGVCFLKRVDWIIAGDDNGLCAQCAKYLKNFVPIIHWLPNYDAQNNLKGDVVGGIVIGLILVCQTMAHAAIATTSTVQGPYCALLPPVIYAIFGTSPHASISSGAVVAVLLASQLEPFKTEEERTNMASMYALLVGILIFVAGIITYWRHMISHNTFSRATMHLSPM